MKTLRVIQFAIAAAVFSIGCVGLLAHAPAGIGVVCFCLPSLILLRRSEAARPVPVREICIGLVILAVLATLIIVANLVIPKPVGEDYIHRPSAVVPFWILAMSVLFWRWRRERKLAAV